MYFSAKYFPCITDTEFLFQKWKEYPINNKHHIIHRTLALNLSNIFLLLVLQQKEFSGGVLFLAHMHVQTPSWQWSVSNVYPLVFQRFFLFKLSCEWFVVRNIFRIVLVCAKPKTLLQDLIFTCFYKGFLHIHKYSNFWEIASFSYFIAMQQ